MSKRRKGINGRRYTFKFISGIAIDRIADYFQAATFSNGLYFRLKETHNIKKNCNSCFDSKLTCTYVSISEKDWLILPRVNIICFDRAVAINPIAEKWNGETGNRTSDGGACTF